MSTFYQYHLSGTSFFKGKKISTNFINSILKKKKFADKFKKNEQHNLIPKINFRKSNNKTKLRELQSEDFLTLYNQNYTPDTPIPEVDKKTFKKNLYMSHVSEFNMPQPKSKPCLNKHSNIKILIDCGKSNHIDTSDISAQRATKRKIQPISMINKVNFSIKNYNSNPESNDKRKNEESKICNVSYLTLEGSRFNVQKPNQDSYLILQDILGDNSYHIFGVLDGHGDTGKQIAEETSNYLSSFYSSQKNNSNIYELLSSNSYKLINNSINKAKDNLIAKKINSDYSGTTINLVYIVKNKLICANLGDSRAIAVGSKNKIIQLSIDHKPDVPSEKDRIESCGGEVGRVNWANFGPYRVWFKGQNYPGLAMSRSLGDNLAHSIGVINTPEIKEIDMSNEKIDFLVIATDGIWEFLNNEKVKDIVYPYYSVGDSKGAARKLVSSARKMWEVKNKMAIDDITVIIIFFD